MKGVVKSYNYTREKGELLGEDKNIYPYKLGILHMGRLFAPGDEVDFILDPLGEVVEIHSSNPEKFLVDIEEKEFLIEDEEIEESIEKNLKEEE